MRMTVASALVLLVMAAPAAAEADAALAAAQNAGCREPVLSGQGESAGGGRYYTFDCADGATAWVDCADGGCRARLL